MALTVFGVFDAIKSSDKGVHLEEILIYPNLHTHFPLTAMVLREREQSIVLLEPLLRPVVTVRGGIIIREGT